MNLSSCYYKDVREFSKRYGSPIDSRREYNNLVSKALEIGKILFKGAQIEDAPDGSVLIALEDEKLLALICLPNQELHAFVAPINNTYFIAINFSFIQLIFNLAFSIWRDQRFLSYLIPYFNKKNIITSEFIPPGFESIFLHSDFDLFSGVKRETFYRCFEQAISFFWLHETAHVFAGHVDLCLRSGRQLGVIDEFLNIAKPYRKLSKEVETAELPYRAFEIQADRWALDKLFGRLHSRISSKSGFEAELISTVIGCTLFPISLHGYNLLCKNLDRNNTDELHPPLWFRADEIIKAEDKSANDQWFSEKRGEKNFELRRFRQQDLIYSGLTGLSK